MCYDHEMENNISEKQSYFADIFLVFSDICIPLVLANLVWKVLDPKTRSKYIKEHQCPHLIVMGIDMGRAPSDLDYEAASLIFIWNYEGKSKYWSTFGNIGFIQVVWSQCGKLG